MQEECRIYEFCTNNFLVFSVMLNLKADLALLGAEAPLELFEYISEKNTFQKLIWPKQQNLKMKEISINRICKL
jgi:hypothetical protein